MPSGRRTTGNGTKVQCREMVDLMRKDPTIGVRIGDSVYSVKGTTGKYLIVQRKTELERTVYEVFTIYVTDFVDLVYNNGDNKCVKAVRA